MKTPEEYQYVWHIQFNTGVVLQGFTTRMMVKSNSPIVVDDHLAAGLTPSKNTRPLDLPTIFYAAGSPMLEIAALRAENAALREQLAKK